MDQEIELGIRHRNRMTVISLVATVLHIHAPIEEVAGK